MIVEYSAGELAGSATITELAGMYLTGEIELIDSVVFNLIYINIKFISFGLNKVLDNKSDDI